MSGSTWGGLAVGVLASLFLYGYHGTAKGMLVSWTVAGGALFILLAFPFSRPAFEFLATLRGSF